MLRALLFDMDETLIDWSRIHVNWADIIREPLRPVHAYLIENGYAMPSLEALSEAYRRISNHRWESAEPPDWVTPSATHNLRDALEEVGTVVNDSEFNEVFRRFAWRPIPGIMPFEDTHTVMGAIRASGLKTGLITNMTIPMHKREVEMTAYNLSQYFDTCLCAADIGHMKPHPLPFRLALEQLNVQPEEAIFIGDSPEHDVAGAHGVGMRAIWVRRESYAAIDTVHPDATVDSLSEILGVLDSWYPGWRTPSSTEMG